jgi:hypothetical protein
MINGRRYHSGMLVQISTEGASLSDAELEHLAELETLQFTFEGKE